jgi:hypothetical protein
MRFAAIYAAVDQWAASPPAGSLALAADVDLDGEHEFILKNDRLFALFEALGGRMTAAWARNPDDGTIYQVSGNFLAYNDADTEYEGGSHDDGSGNTGARRTSGFKDWFAVGPGVNYVNSLYTVAPAGPGAWSFTSPDGKISKTITLASLSNRLRATYQLAGDVSGLYVRFGLSPHLEDLLVNGQGNLLSPPPVMGAKFVSNRGTSHAVTTSIRFEGPGMSGALVNASAIDTTPAAATPFIPDTVNMRNQAHTEQVEVHGTTTTFAFDLQLAAGSPGDADNDGLPDDWESLHGLDPNDDGSIDIRNGPHGDPDSDSLSNRTEWLVGLNPVIDDRSDYPQLKAERQPDGSVRLEFPTIPDRRYRIWHGDDMQDWTPLTPDTITTGMSANPAFERTDPAPAANQSKRFYRLEIGLP